MRRSDVFALLMAFAVVAAFVFFGLLSALSPPRTTDSLLERVSLLVGFSIGGVLSAHFLFLKTRYMDIPLRFRVAEGGWEYEFRDGSAIARRWDDPRLGFRVRDYGSRNYETDQVERQLSESDPISWDIWLTAPDGEKDRGGPIPGRAMVEILRYARDRSFQVSKRVTVERAGEYTRVFTDLRIGGGPTAATPS